MKRVGKRTGKSSPAKVAVGGLAPLIAEVRSLIHSARQAAATTVNTLQVLTNFEIGRRIVEHEQKGEKRAGYRQKLLKTLSAKRTAEFGRGFSKANLEYMRRSYQAWEERDPRIAQSASGQLASAQICQKPSGKLSIPFTLSWSHCVLLLSSKDANIHGREYKLYLPSKELLKKNLLGWTREQEGKA